MLQGRACRLSPPERERCWEVACSVTGGGGCGGSSTSKIGLDHVSLACYVAGVPRHRGASRGTLRLSAGRSSNAVARACRSGLRDGGEVRNERQRPTEEKRTRYRMPPVMGS
jgi:hypothetical protein